MKIDLEERIRMFIAQGQLDQSVLDDYLSERARSEAAKHERDAAVAEVQRLSTRLAVTELERGRLRAAILDIDAHATGYGVGGDDAIHHYIVSAGSLHRALGLVGHTAPKQSTAATTGVDEEAAS